MGYRIEINGDTNGEISWNVYFGTERNENSDAEICNIFNIVKVMANALRKIKRVNFEEISAAENFGKEKNHEQHSGF